MTDTGAKPVPRRGVLGWWSALAFNLGLLAVPVGLFLLVVAMDGVTLVRFEATPAALATARQSIERQAAALIPRDVDRKDALNMLVGREVADGDAEAARGFLMAAGAVLPGPESARLFQSLKANHSDEDLAAAAVRFLDPGLASAYLRIQSGRASGGAGAAFFLIGDERDLSVAARRWLEGSRTDEVSLLLSGLTVVDFSLDADSAAAVRVGASLLKSAKAAGRMSDAMSRSLTTALESAIPPTILRQQLEMAFSQPGAMADEGLAVANSFRASVAALSFQKLVSALRQLRGAAAYTSPAGALHLISQANRPQDFARLHLVAQAGRERAAAVAKRAPATGAFLDAAQVTWRFPPAVLQAMAILAGAILLLAIATLSVLKQAIGRTLRPPTDPSSSSQPRIATSKRLPSPKATRSKAVA